MVANALHTNTKSDIINQFAELLIASAATTPSDSELPNGQIYDNLSPESFDTLVEGIKEQMKRKEILSKHTSPIKQLPNGKWYTRLDGKKIERVNKKDLEDLIIDAYRDENATLSSIYPGYLERRKKDVAATTWQKDIRYFNQFISKSKIATKPLSALDLDDGYQFLDDCFTLKPDLKRRYWYNIYGCLNQMFQYAIDKRLIYTNPFVNMKPKKDLFTPPTKTRDADTVFTKSEQTKVCALAEADAQNTKKSEPLGIILLFNLGLRDGELCALKWGDIEVGRRGQYIHIQREMVANIDEHGKAHGITILEHCKTPAGDRRLQLNVKAIETFKAIKELNDANGIPTNLDDYIFLRNEKGTYLNCTPRSFDPRLRKYCKHAGMDVIKSPHDVRRTVLTNLYEAHMPLKKIQEYAGHSTLQQTMDYIRISDEDLDMSEYLETLSEEVIDTVIPFRKEA